MKITSYAQSDICIEKDNDAIAFTEQDQRYILTWFMTQKLEMVKEVVCAECRKRIMEEVVGK